MKKRQTAAGEGPILLGVGRFEQPDDVTCGPTCLAQVYRFYDYDKSLEEVIRETRRNPDGGTMAVDLGVSALRNGFFATIYPYELRVFDPSWWDLERLALIEKLEQRAETVESRKLERTLRSYISYLRLGGHVRFREMRTQLLERILRSGRPILTGLSATYLYRSRREFQEKYDDIHGDPVGHFVVICGYYPKSDRFVVRDPSSHIPFSRTGRYTVTSERLIPAILLGDVTYDAVLLVLGKR